MPNTATGRARSVIEAARGLQALQRQQTGAAGQSALQAGSGRNPADGISRQGGGRGPSLDSLNLG